MANVNKSEILETLSDSEENISLPPDKNIEIQIKKNNENTKINYEKIILITQISNNLHVGVSKYCLLKNLNNKYISMVYAFGKKINDEEILNHPKFKFKEQNSLTFKNAIEFANTQHNGKIIALCNSDIFLDDSAYWIQIDKLLENSSTVLCQSRYEYKDGKIWKDKELNNVLHSIKQDCWIFKTPLNINLDVLTFDIDNHGACNAFAKILYDSKYIPINSPNKFKVLHFFTGEHIKKNKYPKNIDQYLVPDYDLIKGLNLDSLARQIKLSDIQVYIIKCLMISLVLKISQ